MPTLGRTNTESKPATRTRYAIAERDDQGHWRTELPSVFYDHGTMVAIALGTGYAMRPAGPRRTQTLGSFTR